MSALDRSAKPRVIWTGSQWLCFTARGPEHEVRSRWRTGFGPTPADAYARWLEARP